MAAGDGDFDRALHVALTFHIAEIDVVVFVGGEERSEVAVSRRDQGFAADELEGLAQILDAVDGDSFHHGGLMRVRGRNEDRLFLLAARFERHRQHAFHRTHCAIQRQFADEAESFERRPVQFLGHRDHAERDGQIETRAFFLYVGRREIDGGPSARPVIAAVTDRRRDAIAALFYRGIRQANDNGCRTHILAGQLKNLSFRNHNNLQFRNCTHIISMTQKAISYARYSSAQQKYGASEERQIESAKAYCETKGWELDTAHRIDRGVSAFDGSNATTGELAALLQDIKTGKIAAGTYLLIESLDRLSRQGIMPTILMIQEIVKRGVNVVTLCDGMMYDRDSCNRLDQMVVLLVISSRANEEMKIKQTRVLNGWQRIRNAARTGTVMTETAPAWLRLTADRKFEIIPERAQVVRRIYRLALAGMGKRRIVRALNSEGVPPFDRAGRTSDGWHDSYVQRLLSNPALIGDFQPHIGTGRQRKKAGDVIKRYYPAVLDEVTFFAVQLRCRHAPGRPFHGPINLFSSLLYDGYTGRKMRFINKGKRKSHHGPAYYLVSDAHRLAHPKACRSWPYAHFEKFALTSLRELDWKAIRNEGKSDQEIASETDAIRIESELRTLNQAQERASAALLYSQEKPENLTRVFEQLQRQNDEARRKLAEVNLRLAEHASRNDALSSAPDDLDSFLANNCALNIGSRMRAEIRKRVAKINLFPTGYPTRSGDIVFVDRPVVEFWLTNGSRRLKAGSGVSPLDARSRMSRAARKAKGAQI